jgi:hypothetical protein
MRQTFEGDLVCYLCLFAYIGVQHVLTLWRVLYKRQELLTFRRYLVFLVLVYFVVLLFSFIFCCFVILRPV